MNSTRFTKRASITHGRNVSYKSSIHVAQQRHVFADSPVAPVKQVVSVQAHGRGKSVAVQALFGGLGKIFQVRSIHVEAVYSIVASYRKLSGRCIQKSNVDAWW